MDRPLRVAAIHDLSGVGRCSLTVILPVLSAMGVQVCPVPTAMLSCHFGFGDVVFRDLTDYIPRALENYQELGIDFECIYSGFLGSEEQVDHCLEFFRSYPKALIVVDPVMGDHGKPYKTYTKELQTRMGELVSVADLITPNYTEACILLGEEYSHEPVTRAKAKSMLVRLSELGPKNVVITGLSLATGEIANVGYDRDQNAFWRVTCDYVPVSYPGTGDLYASALIGSLLTGDSLPISMDRATRFAEISIKTTFSYGTETRQGVMLERSLPWLTQREVLKNYQIL
ncbi:pyridoxamine kinase [Merdimmobilis hominis]|jgi:pyridoxine kinase|uniref:pyridoxal kinase n=1 Tax=uncultured Anaerotruncus sp. TaxID=905011 RepID=A0A6N2TY06_9FIRM|nr:pyridoxamine kinase [Merdimmobilis hominis]MCD4835532.1 pyridoxamine kinase [Merdimmobilis hominis]PWL62173.1 MAG: pyridoxamine kinase [Oscillospiraceae bacterium]